MTTVVAHGRAYNINGDNQMLYSHALRFDNVKVRIIEPLDINAYLPYPTDEMTTVGDVIGFFIAWPIGLVSLHAQFYYQNESTSSIFKLKIYK